MSSKQETFPVASIVHLRESSFQMKGGGGQNKRQNKQEFAKNWSKVNSMIPVGGKGVLPPPL